MDRNFWKEILEFFNKAKWLLIIISFATIILTFFIYILMFKHDVDKNIARQKLKKTERKIELLEPPIILNESDFKNILIDVKSIDFLTEKEFLKIVKFKDFGKNLDYFFKNNYLNIKVEEILNQE